VRVGDYAAVGRNVISIADADSFWVDAYFEETQLASVREGDPAEIKLMGYSEIVRGHVGGVARAIAVPNADPNHQGVANVNPIFTWVRLAQRVPVRIQIDQVPEGVRPGCRHDRDSRGRTAASAPTGQCQSEFSAVFGCVKFGP
jgi:multidrug resistance efflux pump